MMSSVQKTGSHVGDCYGALLSGRHRGRCGVIFRCVVLFCLITLSSFEEAKKNPLSCRGSGEANGTG